MAGQLKRKYIFIRNGANSWTGKKKKRRHNVKITLKNIENNLSSLDENVSRENVVNNWIEFIYEMVVYYNLELSLSKSANELFEELYKKHFSDNGIRILAGNGLDSINDKEIFCIKEIKRYKELLEMVKRISTPKSA